MDSISMSSSSPHLIVVLKERREIILSSQRVEIWIFFRELGVLRCQIVLPPQLQCHGRTNRNPILPLFFAAIVTTITTTILFHVLLVVFVSLLYVIVIFLSYGYKQVLCMIDDLCIRVIRHFGHSSRPRYSPWMWNLKIFELVQISSSLLTALSSLAAAPTHLERMYVLFYASIFKICFQVLIFYFQYGLSLDPISHIHSYKIESIYAIWVMYTRGQYCPIHFFQVELWMLLENNFCPIYPFYNFCAL